jgi:hypothetical protein
MKKIMNMGLTTSDWVDFNDLIAKANPIQQHMMIKIINEKLIEREKNE